MLNVMFTLHAECHVYVACWMACLHCMLNVMFTLHAGYPVTLHAERQG